MNPIKLIPANFKMSLYVSYCMHLLYAFRSFQENNFLFLHDKAKFFISLYKSVTIYFVATGTTIEMMKLIFVNKVNKFKLK